MKTIRVAVALFLLAVFLAAGAEANTSSINPNVPAQNSPLSSSVLRGNFGNAYTDENTIYGMLALSSNQLLGTINAGNAGPLNLPTCSTGALSWTPGSGFGCNSLSGLISPVTVPLVFTGAIAFNLNATTLPTKQTGTVVQFGDADTITSRLELDAFAAPAHFSGIRFDGTNASPTTLQSNDEIASFNAFGYNGASVVGPKGSVGVFASQNWTNSADGTYVSIKTALNGTTTQNEVCRFENDGGVTCPATVTGGDQGPGTANLAGVYSGGVHLQNGSFTAGTNMTITGSWPNLTFSSSSGSSGSGTVNSGTTPDLGYYATSSTALSDATGLQYNATTKGLNLNGVNAHSLPDNGLDTTGVAIGASG